MLWNLGKSFDSYLRKLLVRTEQKLQNCKNIKFLYKALKKKKKEYISIDLNNFQSRNWTKLKNEKPIK